MVYPILAFIWLGMAVVMFYFQLTSANPRFMIPETSISFGWVAVLFFFYNMLRWWSYLTTKRIRTQREDALRRHFQKRAEEVTPNPTFQFEDESEGNEEERKPGGR